MDWLIKRGCSDFFVGKETRSRKLSKNLVVPAKAGIHSEVARANSLWVPAFAGTTGVCWRFYPYNTRTNLLYQSLAKFFGQNLIQRNFRVY